jgi:hypothetical protein
MDSAWNAIPAQLIFHFVLNTADTSVLSDIKNHLLTSEQPELVEHRSGNKFVVTIDYNLLRIIEINPSQLQTFNFQLYYHWCKYQAIRKIAAATDHTWYALEISLFAFEQPSDKATRITPIPLIWIAPFIENLHKDNLRLTLVSPNPVSDDPVGSFQLYLSYARAVASEVAIISIENEHPIVYSHYLIEGTL